MSNIEFAPREGFFLSQVALADPNTEVRLGRGRFVTTAGHLSREVAQMLQEIEDLRRENASLTRIVQALA